MRPTTSRRAIFRGTALAAGLLLLVGAVPALAGQPPTTITIEIDLDVDPAVAETFTATGPVLCPSGTAVSTQDHFGGNFRVVGTFHLTKLLTCADNPANTFTIRVNAGATFKKGMTTGGWSVVSGTGAYAGLHGGGNVVGISEDPGGGAGVVDLIDHYTGQVR
jgi:hypothetical protein